MLQKLGWLSNLWISFRMKIDSHILSLNRFKMFRLQFKVQNYKRPVHWLFNFCKCIFQSQMSTCVREQRRETVLLSLVKLRFQESLYRIHELGTTLWPVDCESWTPFKQFVLSRNYHKSSLLIPSQGWLLCVCRLLSSRLGLTRPSNRSVCLSISFLQYNSTMSLSMHRDKLSWNNSFSELSALCSRKLNISIGLFTIFQYLLLFKLNLIRTVE